MEHVPAVLLLRKPLPWLPSWVAFVSLCLPPAESPPLSGKRRRRRGQGGGGEQETGRESSRDGGTLAQTAEIKKEIRMKVGEVEGKGLGGTRQKRFNEQLEEIKAERGKWSPGGM